MPFARHKLEELQDNRGGSDRLAEGGQRRTRRGPLKPHHSKIIVERGIPGAKRSFQPDGERRPRRR